MTTIKVMRLPAVIILTGSIKDDLAFRMGLTEFLHFLLAEFCVIALEHFQLVQLLQWA